MSQFNIRGDLELELATFIVNKKYLEYSILNDIEELFLTVLIHRSHLFGEFGLPTWDSSIVNSSDCMLILKDSNNVTYPLSLVGTRTLQLGSTKGMPGNIKNSLTFQYDRIEYSHTKESLFLILNNFINFKYSRTIRPLFLNKFKDYIKLKFKEK